MTNKKLRADLLQKLKCTPQALSQQVQKIKKQYAMTTEDATYVIAQRKGLILDKYLPKDTIDRVRSLMQHISFNAQPQIKQSIRENRKNEEERVIKIAKEIEIRDPVLPERKIQEAKEMATIYPLLYILENSIREIIDRIMTSKHGDTWWDSEAPRKLHGSVEQRMTDEHKNSWHQRRGSRPIDYLDLNQLPSLMSKIEKDVVPTIIPSLEWFTQLVEEIYKSRCVICHMNPLDRDNIQAVKLRLRHWEKQIIAKKNLIP